MTKDTLPLVATTPMQHTLMGTWHAHTCPALRNPLGRGCTCLWVWIERTADPEDDRGPDQYFGPWPGEHADLAMICANESLMIEGELQPPLGGTECEVVDDQHRAANPRAEAWIINFDEPETVGFDKHGTCKHCGHGIVRIANRVDETWYAPDAGYDRVDGDGIWLDICPDNDTFPNPPHEPMEA